jgi:hypothetical protein
MLWSADFDLCVTAMHLEGRGLIVTKQWVMDSYVKKKRLPASKYRLSGGGGSSSEEEQVYDQRERDLFGAKASDASEPCIYHQFSL